MAVSIENMRKQKQAVSHLNYTLDDPLDDELDENIHPMDTPAAEAKLSKLQDWWSEAKTQHSENRYQMAIDCDFYDGLQWKDEDVEVLNERGQVPLVFNKTAQHINWLLGTERRTRVDFKVHGRSDNDIQTAESKTQLIKYVNDVNKGQYARSKAFSDAMRAGVGWLEDGIRSDPHDELLFTRWEHWRSMWWDAMSKQDDIQDARYLFRVKHVDQDYALAMFPDRKSAIMQATQNYDLFNFEDEEEFTFNSLYQDQSVHTHFGAHGRSFLDSAFHVGLRRQRVKLIECWYREPVTRQQVRARKHALMGPALLDRLEAVDGQAHTGTDPAVETLIANGYASVYDALHMEVRCAIFVEGFLLQDKKSPYNHNRFPFTPIWAYKRDRDGMPYGVIRNMRDPQEDLNKRRSKALFLLSTNQLIADEDAFEDWDEAIDEAARPDGVLKKKRGAEVEINRQLDLAEEHVMLMEQDIKFLESSSGVTEENLGEVTNTNSGRAINLRQTQGSVVTAVLFDNLRQAIQAEGEIQLSLIEQFYAEPKKFRITGGNGKTEFAAVNGLGTADDGAMFIDNDIQASQADFVVDVEDFSESIRLSMFDQLMEMTTRLDPTVTMQILDLIIDLSDVPGKDEIVKRIRSMNGQIDPNDPERESKEQAQQNTKDEQARLAKRDKEAEIRKKESTATQAEAAGQLKRTDALSQAMEIAAMMSENPQLARAVDLLMDGIGSGDTPDLGPIQPIVPAGQTTVDNPLTEPETQEGNTNG